MQHIQQLNFIELKRRGVEPGKVGMFGVGGRENQASRNPCIGPPTADARALSCSPNVVYQPVPPFCLLYLPIYLPVCLPVCVSVCVSVCLSACPPVRLSVCLSVCACHNSPGERGREVRSS